MRSCLFIVVSILVIWDSTTLIKDALYYIYVGYRGVGQSRCMDHDEAWRCCDVLHYFVFDAFCFVLFISLPFVL